MSKFKFKTLIIIVSLMSLIGFGIAGFSRAPESTIQLTTEPSLGQFLPFEAEAASPQSPVQLTLKALSPSRQALESKFHIQLFNPSRNPFLPTDFPVVEGTKLLELEAIAPQGELKIQQMLPIRGQYKLLVNVTPVKENQFSPIEQALTFNVAENPVKYRNFVIIAAILLGVGIVGGLVIGRRQIIQPGEIAPTQVRLLLSGLIVVAIATLLVVNISAEMAESHSHNQSVETPNSTIANFLGIKLQLLGDTQTQVGKLTNFKVEAIDIKTNQPANVTFNIKSTQLENNWTAFAYQGISMPSGQLAWQQQFFDGTPHKLEVEILPLPNSANQFQPVQVSQVIEVEAVMPDLIVRLVGLTYFTGIVVIGLLLGLWLKKRRLAWL